MKEKVRCSPAEAWNQLPGVAADVGAGGGAVWMIGQGSKDSDYGIYLWDEKNHAWVQDPTGMGAAASAWSGQISQVPGLGGAGDALGGLLPSPGAPGEGQRSGVQPRLGRRSNVAVDEHGRPWITDEQQRIFRLNEISWELIAGAARDIDLGGDTAWAIGTGPNDIGGSSLYKWEETRRDWRRDPVCYGARIAVDDQGVPWHVNEKDEIYRGIAESVKRLPGLAKDIGAGGGAVWVIGTDPGDGGFRIWMWDEEGFAWMPDDHGFGIRIAVDSNGCPWVVSSSGNIFRKG